MARRRPPSPPDLADLEGALAALSAEELRDLVRTLLLELDGQAHAPVISRIVDRAARNPSARTPRGPSADRVSSILSFADAARRVGHADPAEVDEYLRDGANAFLRKDYAAALAIFRALLIPVADADIDLGQHETVDEVLGIDVAACAAQYVVATYMTAAPAARPSVVWQAIRDARGIGDFWEPLRELEGAAVEPLPQFDDFLAAWRLLIAENRGERVGDWETDADRWLREAVRRIDGVDGLAKHARATRRADDLSAWCRMLVDGRQWEVALRAFDEAAEILADAGAERGEFLDGAALAAQELGRRDLPARLERSWRAEPSMLRLRRWLGSSRSKAELKKRGAQALTACPKSAARQLAFIHVLLADLRSAAKLLAAAPGLGWSDSHHPGPLLFPLFHALVAGDSIDRAIDSYQRSVRDLDDDELEAMSVESDEPVLAAPEPQEILALAGADGAVSADARATLLQAMKEAADKRLAGVIDDKRRNHYGQAAALARACLAVDPTPKTTAWMARIREQYRRYPALQRALAVDRSRPGRGRG